MKLIVSVAVALVLAAPLARAKDKKKNEVPALFNTARYVYVLAEDGDMFNPRLMPEDRQAIADVEDEIRDWKRYVVVLRQSEAELIMVVRKGRLVAAKVGGGVSVGSRPELGGSYPGGRNGSDPNSRGGVSTEIGGGVEGGPPDDMLRVYSVNPDGSRGALLWTGSMQDGLDAPQVLLVKQLKQAVEKAYPPQTASQPAKKP